MYVKGARWLLGLKNEIQFINASDALVSTCGLNSDFVTNSYGESLDLTSENSWVPVQNQWVPVKNKGVQNWRCLGLYVTRQLIWRLQNSVLQFTEIKI